MKKSKANSKPIVLAPSKAFKSKELANHELVVLAVYLVGGQTHAADSEDIAVKANELAPGRFSWRKYKNQISIDSVKKRLWDAVKPEKGAYLIGTEKTGWRLTKSGFDFARKNMKNGGPSRITKQRVSQNERTAQTREIKRMMHEDAFVKYLKGRRMEITKSDAERFFRIDDYVIGKMRAAKIERFRIMAHNNSELLQLIDFLTKMIGEK